MNKPSWGDTPRYSAPVVDRVTNELPRWQCFCCEDRGIVQFPELIISTYRTPDPPLYCKRCSRAVEIYGKPPGTDPGGHPQIHVLSHMDGRATKAQCDWIHNWNRESWLKSIKNWQEQDQAQRHEQLHQQIQALSDAKGIPNLQEETR